MKTDINSDEFCSLIEKGRVGDQMALAQALTQVEKWGARSLDLDVILKAPPVAFRLGITGPPGAGKSTLVGGLIAQWRAENKRVGVIAVDPSSRLTGGAVLGDRIRYSEHFTDSGVFIRSLGTRGALGGLSASAYLMLRVFDACQFDVVIVETVGVGQTELDVIDVADLVCVVLVPESGDSIQAMKAGLVEIADLFVVNKSDRPGASALVRELEAMSHLVPTGQKPKVVRVFETTATSGEGVATLHGYLREESRKTKTKDFVLRLRKEAQALLRGEMEKKILAEASRINSAEDLRSCLLPKSSAP